jgi:hypothetical protein
MAIVKTGDMYGQVGRLGQNVYYTAYSETRSRKLAASVSNPRTQSQMLQRVRWANLVNFYRVNKEWMKYAFETKKKNQSEYNKFMSLNVATSQIYLTKQEAGGGACVLYNYLITQGSLPSIEQNYTGAVIKTNLYVNGSFVIDGNTRVRELSEALVQNNPALRYGDQLSIIRLYQQANPSTGTPFIVLRKYELVLDANSDVLVDEYWPTDILTIDTSGSEACIAIVTSGRTGGISFVLSRTLSGKTYVSTQRLILAGMDSYISNYTSQMQLQIAINSYGENTEAFLTSTYAKRTSDAPVSLSILSVSTEHGNAQTGGFIKIPAEADEIATLVVQFNGPVGTSTELRGSITIGGELISIEGGEASGNSVTFTSISFAEESNDRWLTRVGVIINGQNYEATFSEIIRNEDTIQGLE